MSVYVGGECGGLIHLTREEQDGSFTLTNTWAASDFDEALEVRSHKRKTTKNEIVENKIKHVLLLKTPPFSLLLGVADTRRNCVMWP